MARDHLRRRVLEGYGEEDAATRLHVRVRSLTAPFDAICALLPAEGHVLDVGCGHGVLSNRIALDHPGRTIRGVDIDDAKVAIARRAAGRLHVDDRTSFDVVDASWAPEPCSVDAVVCTDVLYLMGQRHGAAMVRALAAAVAPGGTMVIKEMGERPRWKHALMVAQEHLSTKVLRITRGGTLEWVPITQIASAAAASGLDVETVDVGQGHLHPHVAVVARRPSA